MLSMLRAAIETQALADVEERLEELALPKCRSTGSHGALRTWHNRQCSGVFRT
jgi:hypothetical protein